MVMTYAEVIPAYKTFLFWSGAVGIALCMVWLFLPVRRRIRAMGWDKFIHITGNGKVTRLTASNNHVDANVFLQVDDDAELVDPVVTNNHFRGTPTVSSAEPVAKQEPVQPNQRPILPGDPPASFGQVKGVPWLTSRIKGRH